jgi:hypothetical protein
VLDGGGLGNFGAREAGTRRIRMRWKLQLLYSGTPFAAILFHIPRHKSPTLLRNHIAASPFVAALAVQRHVGHGAAIEAVSHSTNREMRYKHVK